MADLKTVTNFAEFYEEHKGLMEEHLEGFQKPFKGSVKLDVSVDKYQSLIDSGTVLLLSITTENEFAGYINAVVSQHPLFNTISATVDHVIIIDKFKGNGLFKEVMNELEKGLHFSGVEGIHLALPATSGHDRLASSLGYTKQSSVHNKVLGDM